MVLVSLATAYNDRPDFFHMIAQSARGHVRPEDLSELPPNVEVHPCVPQLAVLERIAGPVLRSSVSEFSTDRAMCSREDHGLIMIELWVLGITHMRTRAR